MIFVCVSPDEVGDFVCNDSIIDTDKVQFLEKCATQRQLYVLAGGYFPVEVECQHNYYLFQVQYVNKYIFPKKYRCTSNFFETPHCKVINVQKFLSIGKRSEKGFDKFLSTLAQYVFWCKIQPIFQDEKTEAVLVSR